MTTQDRPGPVETPVRLLLQEVWSRGDLALVDELVAAEYVRHDPVLPDPVRGPAALAATVATYREAVPDLTKTVEETLVDGSRVVVVATATGTHGGEVLGIEPTGRPLVVESLAVHRVEDGVLVEGTEVVDVLGLLRQTGALPEPLAERITDEAP